MSETHGTQVVEFDVEGHGLLEVAAGLGAAAVVAGASGALALNNPLPGTGTVDRQVSNAVSDVRDARAGAVGEVERTADTALRTTSGAIRFVNHTATEGTRFAQDTANESIDVVLTTSRELYGQVDPRASIDRDEDRITVTVQVIGKTASVTVG